MHPGELELQTPDTAMLQKTQQQLEKDLGIAGFAFREPGYPDLPAMVTEIQAFLEKQQTGNAAALMRIINRVDLSESQYRKVKSMPGDWLENLAKAIVLRVFQKVLIRKNFGGG